MDTSWIAWAVAVVATLLFLRERRLRRDGAGESPERLESSHADGAPPEFGTDLAGSTARSAVKKAAEGEVASEGGPRWVPAHETASVAGRKIGGMVYVGRSASTGPREKRVGASIDPSLPVALAGIDLDGVGVGYWSTYASIAPESRTTYLDWLASGRSDPDYSVGYVFLYFYGLEHRFFFGQAVDDERRAIAAEVERLLQIYGENRSVRDYLTRFLEVCALHIESGPAPEPMFESGHREVPLRVRYAIGRAIRRGETVSADWLLSWLMTHPTFWPPRMPAKRAFPEFRALFRVRFAEKYPRGLKVPVPRRKLAVHYRAASGEFSIDLGGILSDLADISGLTKPLRLATEIANSVCAELGKFSRYLATTADGRDKIDGHLLLPAPIRPLFPCSELESLRAWTAPRLKDGGQVKVSHLLRQLEGFCPDRATKRRLVRAAESLALLSIGMAPDPRFGFRGPRLREPAVLFPLPEGTSTPEQVGDGYRHALLSITMGAFVAHADGEVSPSQRRQLEAMVEQAPGLTASESVRLRADFDWLMAARPGLPRSRKSLAEIDWSTRHEIGRSALAVAAADGNVAAKEINALRALYGTLGLEGKKIYTALHERATRGPAAEPVTVRHATESQRSYEIPARNEGPRGSIHDGIELDQELIAAIRADTVRVSAVLEDVFMDDGRSPEAVDSSTDHSDERPPLAGLDTAYDGILPELISRSTWSMSEFEALAAKFGLMPGGALETLNEWAYDRFEEPLIEEAEELQINEELVSRLQKRTGRVGRTSESQPGQEGHGAGRVFQGHP